MRRFSIRSLMAFVLVSGVGLAALRNAGDLWAGMLLMAALTAVGTAVMGAVILRGSERHWCAGFAFFGGVYLALAAGPWLSDTFQPQLGTTHLLGHVQARIHSSALPKEGELAALEVERENAIASVAKLKGMARQANDPALVRTKKKLAQIDQLIAAVKLVPTQDQFQRVGHSLFAILAGLIGGTIAVWFYRRREPGAMPEPAPSPSQS